MYEDAADGDENGYSESDGEIENGSNGFDNINDVEHGAAGDYDCDVAGGFYCEGENGFCCDDENGADCNGVDS